VANGLARAVERKYQITLFEQAEISSSGAVFLLNDTSQDVGDVGQRIGDQIRIKRIRMMLQFVDPPALPGSNAIRCVILTDKQNTLANAGELFIGAATAHAPMLQYTKDYKLQYAVQYDSFPLNLDQYNPSRMIRMDRQVDIPTRYIQASNTITTGALKIVFISNVPGSSANYPQVTGTVRIDYTDM
jgi:hypothetical protein